MNLSKIILLIVMALLIKGCIVIAQPSRANVHIERELSLSAHQIKQFDITAGSGEFRLIGDDTVSEITVKADIYTTNNDRENYELSLEARGEEAFLVAKHHSTSGMWIGSSPRIDITVTVPKKMNVEIDDGSGDLWLTNIDGTLVVNDGSGDVHLSQIYGNVHIEDGSGELSIKQVKGDLTITDGSGELFIDDVEGDIALEDGSGAINVYHVVGDLAVEDSSGDIVIRDISGHVVVDDGSGDIEIEHVGSLKIVNEGSGDLRVSEVTNGIKIGV